nr:MAG TPA: hypothetical protein [Caudoviricetes sp.]
MGTFSSPATISLVAFPAFSASLTYFCAAIEHPDKLSLND